MGDILSLVYPFLKTEGTLGSLSAGCEIRELFAESFGFVAANVNETPAVCTEYAVMSGDHDAADYMLADRRKTRLIWH